tara:strand:- start:8930 stop:10198 length:1269 start_codon:yes stop_codon:yes gene_type:complete
MAASAVLKIGAKIASKSAGAMKGVAKSSKRLTKSVQKNIKIKKRLRATSERFEKFREERKKRQEKESLLEQEKSQKKGEQQKSTGSGKGPLERLISLIQILLVGFIVNKLPQIIDFIKKVIKVIRDIVDKFKEFFDGVIGFFKSIGKVIGKAFDTISNLNFNDIGDTIKGAFGKLKDAFNGIKDKLLDGVKSFLGLKKKKVKKEINRELTDKDLKDKELKSSVSDVQKTMASKSEEFNDTIKTIEKAGTGVDIVGPENANLTEQVQSTVTKESDEKPSPQVSGQRGNRPDMKGGIDIKIQKPMGGAQGRTKRPTPKPSNTDASGGSSGGSEKIKNSTKTGGTSGSTVNSSVSKTGDALNISKSKKIVSTTTITPERKSKNTVMIVGNKGGQSQSQGGMGSKGRSIVIEEDNSLKDQFALSLF